MTPTDLTVLTNQLMLAIAAYGEYRHDAGRAAGEDAPAQQRLNTEFAEEEHKNIERLVRQLSALAPKVAIATTEQIRQRQSGPTCPICGHGTWLHIGKPSRCCTQIDGHSCGCETTFDEAKAALTVTMCDLRGRFERLDQVSFERGRLSALRDEDQPAKPTVPAKLLEDSEPDLLAQLRHRQEYPHKYTKEG